MSDVSKQRLPRTLMVGAMALGIAGGSYGIATAATGSGSATTTSSSTAAAPAATPAAPGASQPGAGRPWGGQRSHETLLTGDSLTKVTDAALAKVPGGTIVRVETDADGHAAYEAHMTDANGSPVTVYVDKSFDVVSVETR